MEVTNYKCDICGKIEVSCTYQSPAGWSAIHVEAENKDDFWHSNRDICVDCAGKHGLKGVLIAFEKAEGSQPPPEQS